MRLRQRTKSASLIVLLLIGVLVVLALAFGVARLAPPDTFIGLSLPGSTHTTAYTNPVFDADFPDPMILRASDGMYYGYATQTIREGRTINIQVARSQDLVHWEYQGDALPSKPGWASTTQKFWAPHVVERDHTYTLYYAVEPDTRDGMCLAVARAQSPTGPFADVGKPLRCGTDFSNLDPMVFDDPQTGKRWLYFGSDFQPIRVQELAPDGLSLAPGSEPTDILHPRVRFEYENLIEGAFVIARNGYYYLFYSGDNCCSSPAHYAVMIARSHSAAGPFERMGAETDRTGEVILQRNDRWQAPGHNAIITDAAGQDWIVYHAIDRTHEFLDATIPGDRAVRRIMLIDHIVYQDGWPRIQGDSPSATPQQGPSVR